MGDAVNLTGINPGLALSHIKERCRQRREGRASSIRSILVLEGGGMRGVFGAGVCIALEELGYTEGFDEVLGVSAGALNAAYFLSDQAAYGATIYYQDISNHRFVNLLRARKKVNIDFLFQIIRRVKPLDYRRIQANATRYGIMLTRVDTGEPVLVDQWDSGEELLQILRATAAMPVVYDLPVRVRGQAYLDGGVSCPIPIVPALERGGTDIMVVTTKPASYYPSSAPGLLDRCYVIPRLRHHGTPFVRAYQARGVRVREELDLVRGHTELRDHSANIVTLCPDSHPGVRRTTIKPSVLKQSAVQGAQKTFELFGVRSSRPAEVLRFFIL